MAAPAMVDRPRRREHDIESYLRRYDQLVEMRSNWDGHWTEISQLMWPEADDFLTQRNQGGGEKRNQRVFDSTAARALWKFSAALESLLIPRQQKWHRLRSSDEALNNAPRVKAWFEESTRILFAVRNSPKANYYAQAHEGFMSIGAFGNKCIFTDEPKSARGIRYRYCHIGKVYVATNHEGLVDTVYRKFPLSAKAAYQKWGPKAGAKVLTALETNPWKEFDFLHVVAPRDDVDPESLGPESKPWISLYLGCEDKSVTEEGGYHEMPYLYSRWSVAPGEVYGRSPAMGALPDTKGLNKMMRDYWRVSHKAADPPLLLHNDGVIGQSNPVRLQPGGLNYGGVSADGRALIQPLVSGAQPDGIKDIMEQAREATNDWFLITLFRILAEDPRAGITAFEIAQRMQEKGELLAPAVGRLQSEDLGPQIERELAILLRQGALPELPPELLEAGGEYEIEYVSPATQYQRAGELVGIERTVAGLAPLAAADPSLMLLLDGEAIGRIYQEVTGAPAKILRSHEDFEKLRQQQADAAQQAAMPEQMATGAGAAADGAKALQLLQGGAQSAA